MIASFIKNNKIEGKLIKIYLNMKYDLEKKNDIQFEIK